MAGYKRQSPLKKYGQRQIKKLNVDEQKKAFKSNAKAQGSVGRAVGQIGRSVGKGVDKFLDNKKKGKEAKAKEATDNKAAADKKAADHFAGQSGLQFKNPLESIDSQLPSSRPANLGVGQTLPEKQIFTPPPPPPPPPTDPVDPFVFGQADAAYQGDAQPRGAWQGPLVHPTGAVYSTQQDPNLNVGALERGAQAKMDAQRTQMYEGPGGFSNMSGRNPINRISSEYTKSPFRRNPYGNSPLKRMSPLKAKADSLTGGSYVPQEEKMRHLSYLGEEGAAGVEGYNDAIESHNYKQRVWAEKAKDVDEAYGSLVVEPTGVSSWDAAAQTMATEWKKEYTELYNNKDSYDPEEYAQKIDDIRSRASQYQNANTNIQKIVEDYQNRKDDISASTPSSSIDILETLAKGGDGLTTKNINGVPTLVGTTLGGQDVSVPISDIASGKNLWRVNEQYDVSNDIANISDDLGKFKQKMALNGGVTTSNIGWDKLQGRAESKVDAILSNPQRAQAIAAEKFGIDYDEWQEMGDEAAMAQVKQGLMGEIQTQFEPYQQVVQQSVGTRNANEQKIYEQELQYKADNLGKDKPTQSEIKAENAVNVTKAAIKSGDFSQINGHLASKGYTVVMHNGKMVIGKYNKNKKGGAGYETVSGANEQTLIQLLGGRIESPVNRSPFRRLMNFITGS